MSGGASTATVVAIVGASVAAAGTAAGVAGQMQQASAAKASANYQSEVAAGNEQIAKQNASFASQSGEEQAAVQEQKTRAQEGAILASEGSSGVDINSPTATAVRTSQSDLGQLDAQTIRSNAARQAYGYETQATNFGNAASADTATGENAGTSGDIGAGSGLLSGLGNESLNYAKVVNNASGLGGDVGSGAGSIYDQAIAAGQT